jgi:arsenate reductase (glutaredoxin)
MASILLFHNPGCSKSRGALELLQGSDSEVEVVEYLKAPLTQTELEVLLGQLGGSPEQLVRKDKHFKELGLNAGDYVSSEDVARVLADHPRLMERPVAVAGGRAIIGRPPEKVLELLD